MRLECMQPGRKDLLSIATAYVKKTHPQGWERFPVDLSQSVHRKTWALPWGTLTTSAIVVQLATWPLCSRPRALSSYKDSAELAELLLAP